MKDKDEGSVAEKQPGFCPIFAEWALWPHDDGAISLHYDDASRGFVLLPV